jgi:hypothetical protein
VSLYIRLNKQINPQQLLKKIEQEVIQHRNNNKLEDSVLCIEIKNTSQVIENIAREKVSAYLEGSQ